MVVSFSGGFIWRHMMLICPIAGDSSFGRLPVLFFISLYNYTFLNAVIVKIVMLKI